MVDDWKFFLIRSNGLLALTKKESVQHVTLGLVCCSCRSVVSQVRNGLLGWFFQRFHDVLLLVVFFFFFFFFLVPTIADKLIRVCS